MRSLQTNPLRWGTVAVLAACSGGPRPAPTPTTPPVAPAPAPPVTSPAEPAAAPVANKPNKLPNGLDVVMTEAASGTDARLQLCFRTGSLAIAPGLAELAVEALVTGADASQGRPPLTLAIEALGGIVRTEVGRATTWIEVRVPGARWQDAQTALLAALTAPARTRHQLERIREDHVRRVTDEIRMQPEVAMARALLLGESDTASHVRSLLDRDPSEIGLFQARYFRPELSICAMHVPGDPLANVAQLAKPVAGSLARWTPPALSSPSTRTVAPKSANGIAWAENRARPGCRASLIVPLPDLAQPDAAIAMVLQACVTLDGTGGRLERLQTERGLGHLRWSTRLVRDADHTALVMTTDLGANEAAKLWATIDAARRSLRDVPPTPSEHELARRRARLTAGLGQLDEFAAERTRLALAERGTPAAAIERSFANAPSPGTDPYVRAVETWLEQPIVLFVDGGRVPADASGVRRLDLLPPGFEAAEPPSSSTPPAATVPWLDRAAEAIGSPTLLRQFRGQDHESRLQTDGAPVAKETVSWRTNGTLRRTREMLGKVIETKLEGETQIERLGDVEQTLWPREAALVQREMERHPIALLAAHARQQLTFRDVAQRSVGDRDLMILQAEGDRFDRLRVHIDTASHLIRAVEVWETLPDGTTVHLHDAWSDYRTVKGLRVPFRRVTTQDDGQNRVETVFTKWQPEFAAP